MSYLQKVTTKAPSIYLAGKISRQDWRQRLIDLRSEWNEGYDASTNGELAPWPVIPRAIFGAFDYTGPFFISCDHGCYHGKSTHGVGARDGGCGNGWGEEYGESASIGMRRRDHWREQVWQHCRIAIQRADIIFAWLNSPDAYGTLAEIGYAHGLGTRIWIAAPQPFDDLWLVQQMAEKVCVGIEHPEHALASMLLAAGITTFPMPAKALMEQGEGLNKGAETR